MKHRKPHLKYKDTVDKISRMNKGTHLSVNDLCRMLSLNINNSEKSRVYTAIYLLRGKLRDIGIILDSYERGKSYVISETPFDNHISTEELDRLCQIDQPCHEKVKADIVISNNIMEKNLAKIKEDNRKLFNENQELKKRIQELEYELTQEKENSEQWIRVAEGYRMSAEGDRLVSESLRKIFVSMVG